MTALVTKSHGGGRLKLATCLLRGLVQQRGGLLGVQAVGTQYSRKGTSLCGS